MKTLVKTGFLRSISFLMVFALAGIILITLGALRCSVATAQSATVIPSTLFGMTLTNGPSNPWPSVSVGALGKVTGGRWPDIEPQSGVFDWTKMDAGVSMAASHGVDLFMSTNFVPPWAASDQSTCYVSPSGSHLCTSTVANIADWDAFITAVATRYKGKLIYELWNEPDASSFTGTISDLVLLTTHEYNIIRSIDPGALILSPSPTASGHTYMDNYWTAGGPTGVDAVGFHSYHSTPEDKITNITAMQRVMASHNLSSKPLWDTEGSWGTFSLTSDQHAGYVARDYLLQWSNHVVRYYWYGWNTANYGTLWTSAGGPTAGAAAYQQVYNWMVGATMSSPCTMAADSTWTCTLTRPGGYHAQAVWNSTTTLSYTPTTQFTQYLDLAGHANPIQGAVTIGYDPILLVSSTSTPPSPPTNLNITVH